MEEGKQGKLLIFFLEFWNQYKEPYAKNIIIEHTATPEKSLQFIKAKSSVGYKIRKNKIIFDPYPKLQPNDVVTYQIIYKILSGKVSKHETVLSCDQYLIDDVRIDWASHQE